MQNNFAIEYQPTFFRKLHRSTLAESQKKIVYNYLDVLNLECFDQLIMIATVKQTMYLLIL
jgi:mRNA-degrading endonuclease RelE of RelBE toxin-antitoxin system